MSFEMDGSEFDVEDEVVWLFMLHLSLSTTASLVPLCCCRGGDGGHGVM